MCSLCRLLVAKKSQFWVHFDIWGLLYRPLSPMIAKFSALNLPLCNGIKIVSVLQRLHGEIGRTISDVQKRDEQTNKQTNRQTKNSTFLATPAAAETRAPPNLAR